MLFKALRCPRTAVRARSSLRLLLLSMVLFFRAIRCPLTANRAPSSLRLPLLPRRHGLNIPVAILRVVCPEFNKEWCCFFFVCFFFRVACSFRCLCCLILMYLLLLLRSRLRCWCVFSVRSHTILTCVIALVLAAVLVSTSNR